MHRNAIIGLTAAIVLLVFLITHLHRPTSPSSSPHRHQPTPLRKLDVNLSSYLWAPIIVTDCGLLDSRSAPCILENQKKPSPLLEAQELIYRPFKLRVPKFMNATHTDHWFQGVRDLDRMRLDPRKEWSLYPTQYGQNLVFANAVYRGTPPADVWSDSSCMGRVASHRHFLETTESISSKETVVIATSPDSWSWQHFMDRVTVVWSQAQWAMDEHDKGSLTIVSGREPTSAAVLDMYKHMARDHLHSVKTVSARKLIFSCRAPLIHPYTFKRFLDALDPPADVPFAAKKVVVVMPRGIETDVNGGRRILNQQELTEKLEQLLRDRGQSEKLIVFNHKTFGTFNETRHFFQRHVKAIVAPHGAALYNARFAGKGTLILEIMPSKRFGPYFWEQSHLAEQRYMYYHAESLGLEHNMFIHDVDRVVQWLDKELETPVETTLESTYPWDVDS